MIRFMVFKFILIEYIIVFYSHIWSKSIDINIFIDICHFSLYERKSTILIFDLYTLINFNQNPDSILLIY